MKQKIEKIIAFKISGKFAHFRKFYTNASSLSYLIPPKTTVMGIIASVLEISRDHYYEIFDDNKLEISVSIPKDLEIRKQTQTINNLHKEYYKILSSGKGKIQHSQCKLELLMYPLNDEIIYNIYIGGKADCQKLIDFEERLRNGNIGYGVYLGQRQFKAFIELIKVYNISDIMYLRESNKLDSACIKHNFVDCNFENRIDILSEQMPCRFKTINKEGVYSREQVYIDRIYFERKGKTITGKFLNSYKIDDKIISFY